MYREPKQIEFIKKKFGTTSIKSLTSEFGREFQCSISEETIRRLLEKYCGYEKSKHGGYRHGMTEEQLRKAYEQCNGDPNRAAKEVFVVEQYAPKRIARRWARLGLEAKVKPIRKD